MLLAWIWHYWLGVGLVIGTVLTLIGLAVSYLIKVELPRYPRRDQQK